MGEDLPGHLLVGELRSWLLDIGLPWLDDFASRIAPAGGRLTRLRTRLPAAALRELTFAVVDPREVPRELYVGERAELADPLAPGFAVVAVGLLVPIRHRRG